MADFIDENKGFRYESQSKSVSVPTMGHFLALASETPYLQLRCLSQSTDPEVRALVGRRTDVPTHLLARLAMDHDPMVRRVVAANHRTPLDSLKLLALDDDIVLRFGLVKELDLSEEVLLALAEHKNPYIKKQAWLALERRQLEELLTNQHFEPKEGITYRLGPQMVADGLASTTEMADAARMALLYQMKIGQAVVQSGLAMKEIVVRYLLEQSKVRLIEAASQFKEEKSKEP